MLKLRLALSAIGLTVGTGLGLSTSLPSHAQFWEEEPLPMVLTPARLKQSRNEVPASVSVIDRKMIDVSGIRNIPELFRLIPGTFVAARDGWNYVVSYHGTNYRDSRRMQVLIDGRSAYQVGLATVDWNDIPLTIEDIERIEIVRGPSTASYGANAFLGVINIITRHPADNEKLQLTAKRGDVRVEDYRLSHAGVVGDGNYRLTLASRRDDGFEIDMDGNDRRDSDNSDLFNFRYEKPLSGANLSVGVGYKEGWITDDYNESWITPLDTYTEDFYTTGKISWDLSSTHSQHFRVDLSGQKQILELTTSPIPPAMIGLNEYPADLVLADTNENILQRRYDAEFQDTKIWSKTLKTVSGFHYKHDFVNSATFYNGRERNDNYQLFTNIEQKITEKVVANLGMSWEDDNNSGAHFSPRVALHYHFTPNHSLRAVYSEAVRTPDLLETSVEWIYHTYNVRELDGTQHEGMTTGAFNCPTQGNPNLNSETIRSREFGYYGNFQDRGLQVDLKVFDDKLRELVSSTIACTQGDPTNNNFLNQRGAELEVDYRPNHKILIHANYSYIDSETDPVRLTEVSFTPRNASSLLLAYNLTHNTVISAARYYTEDIIGRRRNVTFSRSDFRLSHTVEIGSQSIELSYVYRQRHDDNSELLANNIYRDHSKQLFTINYRY
jgi:iron complex outermembrane recepter protein